MLALQIMMMESRNRRRWIGVIGFWILFVASIAFVRRYPWLDTVWLAFLSLLVATIAFRSVRGIFRHGDRRGEYIYYSGVPKFLWCFVLSDEKYEKRKR